MKTKRGIVADVAAASEPSGSQQRVDMPRRPGGINRARGGWRPACHWCGWSGLRPTYQEASIALTHHLDQEHVGWEKRHINQLSDHWPTVTLGGKETMEQPECNETAKRASGSLERMVSTSGFGRKNKSK